MRGPKRFLAPVTGFRRENCGFSAPGVGLIPVCRTFATTPATRQTPAIGPSVSPIVLSVAWNMPFRPAPVSITCGWAMLRRPSLIEPSSAEITCGAISVIANSPATSTTAPLASGLLATWPFLRASSRCLGVAFSVLLSPAMATRSGSSGAPARRST
jgi:hypothetical protein